MKKILTYYNGLKKNVCLVVLLMMLLSPTTTWAKVGETFDDGVLKYKVTSEEDKEVTVWVYAGEEPTGDLVIPATVTNNDQEYSVTGIDKNAFRDCSGLTSVFIPSSVKTIGGGAFFGCSHLIGITIPKGVTTIGLYAFKDCTRLEWVSIGRDVTRIERDAFKGCEKVEKVFCYATPDQLNWNDYACDDFKSDGSTKCLVREDDLAAFKAKWSKGYMPTDINVSFTDGLGLFDDGYFKYRIIDEDENTVAINGYVGEKPVGDLEISGSTSTEYLAHMHFSLFDVISIDDAAFAGCTGLTSVTISSGVKSIGENAFSGCEGLTSVDIGKDVVNIGKDAFYGCENVTEIHCNSDPAKLTWDDDGCNDFKADGSTVCYVKDPKTWKAKFNGIVNVTFKMEADGVFAKDGLQYSLSDVKLNLVKLEGFEDPYNPPSEIVIPATVEYNGEEYSVTAIGTAAFYECKALTTVSFAENSKVTEIGTAAFFGCENLSSINLPEGLKTIQDAAFYACENLSSINFPEGLETIEEAAFAYCPKLESIDLPDGFVGLGKSAFMNSGLISVNLPTSVEDIYNYVFMGCSSLKSINLPANLTVIGAGAFSECTSLSSISFPDKLTYILTGAFSNCKGLTDIIIPASVQVIESDAFVGCANITDVYCYADPDKLKWTDDKCNDFKANKATVCHVDKDKLADFKAKWSTGNTDTDINVTFERIYQKNDMAFEKNVVDTYYGTTDFEPALTNPHSLTVAYSSSDETVATVNAETGKVKIQKVGQAVITATFDDSNTDYKPGTVSYTLNVKAKTVNNPPVALEKTYYFYDGKAKTPAVSVLDGQTVIPASEYTVGYSNNTNVGTATVTITDKDGGNYTVSGSATFEIGLKGDANGDNKVDAADIVEMVNETKGQPSAKFKKNNADIDGNGQITNADINEVAKIILGK